MKKIKSELSSNSDVKRIGFQIGSKLFWIGYLWEKLSQNFLRKKFRFCLALEGSLILFNLLRSSKQILSILRRFSFTWKRFQFFEKVKKIVFEVEHLLVPLMVPRFHFLYDEIYSLFGTNQNKPNNPDSLFKLFFPLFCSMNSFANWW